jgi:prepilin-type N-terminal cleavage/methylation domain-containing protein
MRKNKENGFSLTEILIALAIIAVLAALLFPAAGGMIEKANTAKCASNLKQISTALH